MAGTCSGGAYGVTLAMGPGTDSPEVTAQVLISDAQARVWQVRWHGWEDQLPIAKLSTEGDDIDKVAYAFQPLGDLDDGDERLVWLRPHGAQEWCKVTARLG